MRGIQLRSYPKNATSKLTGWFPQFFFNTEEHAGELKYQLFESFGVNNFNEMIQII